MKHGNKINLFIIIFYFFNMINSHSTEKVISTPLINLNELEPSFEDVEESNKEEISGEKIKDKGTIIQNNNSLSAKFIGLDKITAKTSEIIRKLYLVQEMTYRFTTMELIA